MVFTMIFILEDKRPKTLSPYEGQTFQYYLYSFMKMINPNWS